MLSQFGVGAPIRVDFLLRLEQLQHFHISKECKATSCFLSSNGYNITAMDIQAPMLIKAKERKRRNYKSILLREMFVPYLSKLIDLMSYWLNQLQILRLYCIILGIFNNLKDHTDEADDFQYLDENIFTNYQVLQTALDYNEILNTYTDYLASAVLIGSKT
jgi:hypothetical protein